MNTRLIAAAVATAIGSGSLIAHAGDWYVTGGFGQTTHSLNSSQVNDDWAGSLVKDGYTFDLDGSGVSSSLAKHTNSAWRAGVGYEFLPFLDGEVEYLHLGRASAGLKATADGPEGAVGSSSYNDTAWGVSAVAKWPFIISPYARLGVLRWEQSVHGSGTVTPGNGSDTPSFAYSNNGQNVYGGVGIEYKIPATPVGFRAEWDATKIGDSKPQLWTLSVVFTL
jgi:hypothetical protein